jgi:hypothetical protein
VQPEVFTERVVDVRSDVWALGLSLLEMAQLQHPYQQCQGFYQLNTLVTQRASSY